MVAQGAILEAGVGLVAFVLVALVRLLSLKNSSVSTNHRKETKTMQKNTLHSKLFGYAVLETIWAIGASSAASALPT